MNNITTFPSIITHDQVPGENFLISCLQKQLTFNIGDRIIKRGRLLLFRRIHYYIQISLLNDKNARENFEIPIPFRVEPHNEEGLLYFDYRTSSLNVNEVPKPLKKVSSTYFDKILEIAVA
jgi:hypothetical protein